VLNLGGSVDFSKVQHPLADLHTQHVKCLSTFPVSGNNNYNLNLIRALQFNISRLEIRLNERASLQLLKLQLAVMRDVVFSTAGKRGFL